MHYNLNTPHTGQMMQIPYRAVGTETGTSADAASLSLFLDQVRRRALRRGQISDAPGDAGSRRCVVGCGQVWSASGSTVVAKSVEGDRSRGTGWSGGTLGKADSRIRQKIREWKRCSGEWIASTGAARRCEYDILLALWLLYQPEFDAAGRPEVATKTESEGGLGPSASGALPYFDVGLIDRRTLAGQIRFKVNSTWIKENTREIVEELGLELELVGLGEGERAPQRQASSPAKISLQELVAKIVDRGGVPKAEVARVKAAVLNVIADTVLDCEQSDDLNCTPSGDAAVPCKGDGKAGDGALSETEGNTRSSDLGTLGECIQASTDWLRDLVDDRMKLCHHFDGRQEVIVEAFRERDLYPLHVSELDWRHGGGEEDSKGHGCSPNASRGPSDGVREVADGREGHANCNCCDVHGDKEQHEDKSKKNKKKDKGTGKLRRAFSVDHSVRANRWARNDGFVYRFYWPFKLEYFLADVKPRGAASTEGGQAEINPNDRVLDEVFLTQKFNTASKRLMVAPPLRQEDIEAAGTAKITVLTHADMWRFLYAFPASTRVDKLGAPTREEWVELLEFPGLASHRVLDIVRKRGERARKDGKLGAKRRTRRRLPDCDQDTSDPPQSAERQDDVALGVRRLQSGPFVDPEQLLTSVVGSYPEVGDLTGLAGALFDAFTEELNEYECGTVSKECRLIVDDPRAIRATMDAGMVGPATVAAIAAQLAPDVTLPSDKKRPSDVLDDWLSKPPNRRLVESRRLDVISTGQASMTALGDMVKPFEELVRNFPPKKKRRRKLIDPDRGKLRLAVKRLRTKPTHRGDEGKVRFDLAFVNELRMANAFLDFVQRRYPELYRPLKVNLTGPATLAVGVRDLPERAIDWIRAYSEFLPQFAKDLADEGLLRHMHHFQVDEPVLTVSNFSNLHPEAFTFDVPMMVKQLERVPVAHYKGRGRVPVVIHMCGMFDPSRIAALRRGAPYALDVELAHLLGSNEGMQQDVKGICKQLRQIGESRLAIGVVDHTSHEKSHDSVVQKLAIDMRDRLGREHLTSPILLTPDCGLRGLDAASASQKLESLRRARTLIARLNGDDGLEAHQERSLILRANKIAEDDPVCDKFGNKPRLEALATSQLKDLLKYHADGKEIVARLARPIEGDRNGDGDSGAIGLLDFLQRMMSECDAQLERFDHTLWNYTDHGVRHSRSVMLHTLSLIGGAWRHLTDDELAGLLLAAYAHDLGQTYLDNPTRPAARQLFVVEEPGEAAANRVAVGILRKFRDAFRNDRIREELDALLLVAVRLMGVHASTSDTEIEHLYHSYVLGDGDSMPEAIGKLNQNDMKLAVTEKLLAAYEQLAFGDKSLPTEWTNSTQYAQIQSVWSHALREVHGMRGAKLLRRFAASYIGKVGCRDGRLTACGERLGRVVGLACWPITTHQSKAATRLTKPLTARLGKAFEVARIKRHPGGVFMPAVDTEPWLVDVAPSPVLRSELLAAVIRLADEIDWGPHRTYREDRQDQGNMADITAEEYAKSKSVQAIYVNHALQRIEVVANLHDQGKHDEHDCRIDRKDLVKALSTIGYLADPAVVGDGVEEKPEDLVDALRVIRDECDIARPVRDGTDRSKEESRAVRPLPCGRRLDQVLGCHISEKEEYDDKSKIVVSHVITPRNTVVDNLVANVPSASDGAGSAQNGQWELLRYKSPRDSELKAGSATESIKKEEGKSKEQRLREAALLVFRVATQVYRQLYDTGLDPSRYAELKKTAREGMVAAALLAEDDKDGKTKLSDDEKKGAKTAEAQGISAHEELVHYAHLSPMSSLLALGVRVFDVVIRVPGVTKVGDDHGDSSVDSGKIKSSSEPKAKAAPLPRDTVFAFRNSFLDHMRIDPDVKVKESWQPVDPSPTASGG